MRYPNKLKNTRVHSLVVQPAIFVGELIRRRIKKGRGLRRGPVLGRLVVTICRVSESLAGSVPL